jgi:hypothetical protein
MSSGDAKTISSDDYYDHEKTGNPNLEDNALGACMPKNGLIFEMPIPFGRITYGVDDTTLNEKRLFLWKGSGLLFFLKTMIWELYAVCINGTRMGLKLFFNKLWFR